MNKCENCGNDYERAFLVTMAGKEHTFDSFECAINILAPKCSHCETRIIGHGVESEGRIFLLRSLCKSPRRSGTARPCLEI